MPDLARTVVIGTSGVGKSTLAGALAERLGCEHIELDALYWRAGWTPSEPEVLRRSVEEGTVGERWVVDGNYAKLRDIVWTRATAVVWLDYSFATIWRRVFPRTLMRGLTRRPLFSGNRESLFISFCTRDSLLLWVFKTYRPNRIEYDALFNGARYAHLDRIRHRKPAETRRFLAEIGR